ncbi:MAG: SpoIIE family protein phosphatase [Bacteroidota bacterium]
MIPPQIPEDEKARLSALYDLKILDTPAEDRFDKVVEITSDFFEVPICYISFVDNDRQWLKASCGLQFKQSERKVSFCGHAIVSDSTLVVPDATKDERFHDNPLVVGHPYMKFYAGVPIKTVDGFKVGTLCIADNIPKELGETELNRLSSFASIVEDMVNLYDSIHLKSQIEEQKQRIEQQSKAIRHSINYARLIQVSSLQTEEQFKSNFSNSFIVNIPKDVLSGDFFWSSKLNGLTYIAAADCTGHGVPGALVSITCFNALEYAAGKVGTVEVGKILDLVNILIQNRFSSDENINDGMDICLICIDEENHRVFYAGAHNPLYVARENGKHEADLNIFKANNQPIGRFARAKTFETKCTMLQKGDVLYLLSDGLQSQFSEKNDQKFGRTRLRQFFKDIHYMTTDEKKGQLEKTFEEWKGNVPQTDDVLVLGLTV